METDSSDSGAHDGLRRAPATPTMPGRKRLAVGSGGGRLGAAATSELRGGLVGGLITPALAVGAALGEAGGLLGPEAGPASGIAAYALVAGAGTLAVSQRSVLFALALVWELTRVPWQVAAVWTRRNKTRRGKHFKCCTAVEKLHTILCGLYML